MIVPLRRPLTKDDTGRDVVAVKRALRQLGLISNTTRLYGAGMVKAVLRFQRDHALAVDGEYGKATHAKLAPYFDAYSVWLMAQPAVSDADKKRQKAVAAAILTYNNREAIHYTQGGRRMEGVTEGMKPPRYPRYADCSSMVTWWYYAAGAKDPNGRGYDGYGYTGTLVLNGRVVSEPRPGDLIFYNSPISHVAMAVGDNPKATTRRTIGHGSEAGPLLLDMDYRSDRVQIRSYL